jgi:hypothetical protein
MTNTNKKVRCTNCVYARQDKNASDYTQKRCKTCDKRDDCEICVGCAYCDTCHARTNPKLSQSCDRRFENLCSMQALKWAAIECGNLDSEYHKALLNVSLNGDRQPHITWSGCPCGERRDRR